MRNKLILESGEALAVALAAKDCAAAGGHAVSIAVVDDAGLLLAFLRMDGATSASGEMSIAKAKTAATGRRSTHAYEAMLNEGRVSLATAPGMTCIEGALPLQHDGHWLGAIGVSGVASSEDARIALAGINALQP